MNEQDGGHTLADATGRQLALLLCCFDQPKAARRARRHLDAGLQRAGDQVLDTVIMEVNAKHTASVHDPRKDTAGALTAALTWGVFGLLTGGGARGLVTWALIGAVCGGLFAYVHEHVLAKPVLARIGTRLPASSSGLLTFAYTRDPVRLLRTSVLPAPTVTTAVTVDGDLAAHAVVDPNRAGTSPASHESTVTSADQTTLLSMVVVRYDQPGTAEQIASQLSSTNMGQDKVPQIELLTRADGGRLRVVDPSHGIKAMATSDVVSWGGLGLIFGAVAGAVAGGGILSSLGGAAVTGAVWAAFGLAAGALYGMWAGRAISARRLKPVRQLVGSRGSSLLAWVEGPVSQHTLSLLSPSGSRSLLLRFDPVDRGTVLALATAAA